MFSRRITMAGLSAVLVIAAGASPAAAAKPRPKPAPQPVVERPLTPDEQAESDAAVAAAMAYVAAADAEGLATLSCVSPTGGDTADDAAAEVVASAEPAAVTPQGCYVPSDLIIGFEARDQTRSHYCGPAVGQVIANHSWAMGRGRNVFTQAQIADWMETDTFGGTNAHRLEDGLEIGTIGSPRRPGNWNWIVTDIEDWNHNGMEGDDLQRLVRANVSGSNMPLAIPVKPHEEGSKYFLPSWPKAVDSIGHWIAAYGWYAYYTGSNFARIWYTDSSRDEGGSTGKFSVPTRTMMILVRRHTGRVVW